jgi:hypothetical protein
VIGGKSNRAEYPDIDLRVTAQGRAVQADKAECRLSVQKGDVRWNAPQRARCARYPPFAGQRLNRWSRPNCDIGHTRPGRPLPDPTADLWTLKELGRP